MVVIALDDLKNRLIKNELSYNNSLTCQAKQYFYNLGYIYIHHFKKNYDVSQHQEFIDFLYSSTLYTKISHLLSIQKTQLNCAIDNVSGVGIDDGIVDIVSDAVLLRLSKIDNLILEIKSLLNKSQSPII